MDQIRDFARLGVLENGYLRFPTLYNYNKEETKILVWTIYVGLQDEDLDHESFNSICIEGADVEGVALLWTESGAQGFTITRSANTEILQGKNLGKKNATTCVTQAISMARSRYNSKLKSGFKKSISDLRGTKGTTLESLALDTARGEFPWRVFAMALHDFNKHSKHITYPATLQPKYDGSLYIVVHHPVLPEVEVDGVMMKVDGYSRSRETYQEDHILTEIYQTLLKFPGLHLVGELWKEGYSLQDIAGQVRRKADTPLAETVRVDYYLFDCFVIGEEKGFRSRLEVLAKFLEVLGPCKYVKPVFTGVVRNEKEVREWHDKITAKGLEGVIVRNEKAPYQYGINLENRSYESLKLKPRFDAEWPVVGFAAGAGKDAELVTWICAENDDGVQKRTGKLLPLEDRKTFSVTPNQTAEIRRHIYLLLRDNPEFFQEHVYGKLLTVTYFILYDNTYIPAQPRALRFRDPEVDLILEN